MYSEGSHYRVSIREFSHVLYPSMQIMKTSQSSHHPFTGINYKKQQRYSVTFTVIISYHGYRPIVSDLDIADTESFPHRKTSIFVLNCIFIYF